MSDLIDSQKKQDLRDIRKILLNWPSTVGYDGSDPNVLGFYARVSGTTKNKNSLFHKKKLTDIFIYAMTLGKNAGITKDYEKREHRHDSINIDYFASQPHYIWMMVATALEETNGDITIFQEPKRIVDICEKYANYGITLLINMEEKATAADPYIGYEELFDKSLEEMKVDPNEELNEDSTENLNEK